MAARDPDLAMLLEHANRIDRTLDAIQKYVLNKSSRRRRRRRRGMSPLRTEHSEPPPWFRQVAALLNKVRAETQSLRSETKALVVQQKTPVATRRKPPSRDAGPHSTSDRHRADAARGARTASGDETIPRRSDCAPNAPASIGDIAARCSRRATEATATLNVEAASPVQHGEAPATEPPAKDQNESVITAPNGSSSGFTLTSAEMGEGLIPALEKIIPHPDFHNEISIPHNPIDLATFQANLDVCANDCQYTTNTFQRGPKGEGYGFVFAPQPTGRPVPWPEHLEAAKTPTIAEARQYLDNYVGNLPTKPVFYYSGHASSVPHRTPLYPGHEILANEHLADLHNPYYHVGVDGSANRFHWEDLSSVDGGDLSTRHGLRSANVVLYGVKLWILIAMDHTTKFEEFVSTHWDCNTCSNRVGHQSLLIAPWRLEKEGINFTIHVATPGKMIIPDLCQYHCVVNMGFCIAQSINFKLAADQLVSSTHISCDWCGLIELTREHSSNRVAPPKSSRKRRAQAPLPAERPTKRVQSVEVTEILRTIRREDPGCIVPQVDGPNALEVDVLVLAAAIQSSLAIAQFVSLVREWRSSQTSGFSYSSDKTSVEYHIRCLQASMRNLALGKFIVRLCQMRLAQEAGKIREETGLQRTNLRKIQRIADESKMDKKELKRHLEEGRWWVKLCGPHEGLLPFILLKPGKEAPFDIKKDDWRQLVSDEAKLKAFHLSLDAEHIQKISDAGKLFDGMMTLDTSKRFQWEDQESFDTQAKNQTGYLSTII
ncbi:unnamed protein product [Clonostachys rosea]|uniref:JmjC domain-containing protein n=1 Tax=Bionectria ochroleuca TaxID=29856 RepID=A0ABY6UZT7_BIOOC|nr:unnamed protein product [Clonostachys rosea]